MKNKAKEIIGNVKARLVSQKEVIDLLIEKRSYAREDDLLWSIYTSMIQNVKQLPDASQQKPEIAWLSEDEIDQWFKETFTPEEMDGNEGVEKFFYANHIGSMIIDFQSELKIRIQPSDLQKEVERLKLHLQMHIDALDLSNLDFYNKYGFNVAETFPRTREALNK